MRFIVFRHATMAAAIAIVLALFTCAGYATGTVSSARALLIGAAIVFGYIISRLSHAMIAADAARRRRARRRLILIAAIPALLLTPMAIGSSPPEFTPVILLVATVWLALTLTYTSFFLGRAGRMQPPRN